MSKVILYTGNAQALEEAKSKADAANLAEQIRTLKSSEQAEQEAEQSSYKYSSCWTTEGKKVF